jgi:catechol 2,3-dioxygenase-like lactoylglutathione lyase family enzyme
MVPTTDQARSLAFYELLGFEVRANFPWADGHRWIEVYPPGTSTGLSLIPAGPDPVGIRTGIILNTRDIEAAHVRMVDLGIDVDPAIARVGSPAKARIGAVEQAEPTPPMFWFRDPDGNELLLVQPDRT